MLLFLAHRLDYRNILRNVTTFKHSNNKQKIHKDKQSQEIPWEYKKNEKGNKMLKLEVL